MAAIAGADLMGQRFSLLEVAAGLKVGKNRLARFHRSHAGVLAAVKHLGRVGACVAACLLFLPGSAVGCAGHAAVIGQHTHHRQVMALADL